MLYVSSFLICSVLASKVIQIAVFDLPAAVIVYPLIFILDDILAEVYGYRNTRPIIWFALLCSFVQLFFLQVSVVIPPLPEWPHQQAYADTLGAIPRIVLAGFIAIAFAQFINAYLLAKLKIKYHGKYLALRLTFSTFVGVSVDAVIFIIIAFWGKLASHILVVMILSQIVIKVLYQILLLPLITFVIRRLKRSENVDYYDTNTNFNPFARH